VRENVINLLLTCGILVLLWISFDYSPARILRKIVFNTPLDYNPSSLLGMIIMGMLDLVSMLIVLIPLMIVFQKFFG